MSLFRRILSTASEISSIQTKAPVPRESALTEEMLRHRRAATFAHAKRCMGWLGEVGASVPHPQIRVRPRAGRQAVALGYHTAIGDRTAVESAAKELKRLGAVPLRRLLLRPAMGAPARGMFDSSRIARAG